MKNPPFDTIELSDNQIKILYSLNREKQPVQCDLTDSLRLQMFQLVTVEPSVNADFCRMTITGHGKRYRRWLRKPIRTWIKQNWILIATNIATFITTNYKQEIWDFFYSLMHR